MNWQKELRFSQKRLTSESFDNDNKITLKSFFAFCSLLFTRTNGGTMETTSRRIQCPVSKILQRYIKELKLRVLLVLTESTFSTWRICFFLSRKAFVMCYCFRATIKTFFFDACQMIVKSCVLHLFPVPQNRKKPYNEHLISLVFSVRAVN